MQNRHHPIDKAREGIRRAALNDKTVGPSLFKPELQTVGDLLRRTGEKRARAGGFQRDWRRVSPRSRALRLISSVVLRKLFSRGRQYRERFIQRILRKVMMFEIATEVVEGILNRYQRGGRLVLLFDVVGIVTNNHADAPKICSWLS